MPLKVHKNIESLVPYVPGKPIDDLERELGISRAVKLASNENPIGPSPKAVAVLAQAATSLNRYPDGGAHRLRAALAERWKVTPDHVILGNGSDEILGMLARAFLSPGDEAVMADHTFAIYKNGGDRGSRRAGHHSFEGMATRPADHGRRSHPEDQTAVCV